jgi:cell division protein FtsB
MRKKLLLAIFLVMHLVVISLQVYKYSVFASLDEWYHRHQEQQKKLLAHKDELKVQLAALQDKRFIQEFAKNELNMQPITFKQIYRVQ